MRKFFAGVYSNRKVLVTGHTGFKGSWLVSWLRLLGAEVIGFALPPETDPCHFDLIDLSDIKSVIGNILDLNALKKVLKEFKPDIVFHLAAQSLVCFSYENPIETLNVNVIGLANVLEACRFSESVRAIVNVTSDKCYENREWVWGYRENDPLGGYDPYSASKGCSELITSSYRKSFFNTEDFGKEHHILLSSARAGNVIGGGDWAQDRIVSDFMRSASEGETLKIRNPYAVRPWQHVLEPLSGYLLLGQKLLEGKIKYAEAWNFGPKDDANITVMELVLGMKKIWGKMDYLLDKISNKQHESGLLKLDCSKAHSKLRWNSVWDIGTTIKKTVRWYQQFYEQKNIITKKQIKEYIKDAEDAELVWTG